MNDPNRAVDSEANLPNSVQGGAEILLQPVTAQAEDDFDFDEAPEEDDEVYAQAWKAGVEALQARCASAGIKCEAGRREETDDDYVIVYMKSARGTRPLTIHHLADLNALLAEEFERYNFLSPYEAVSSYQDGYIEAAIRPLNQVTTSMVFRRLLGKSLSPYRAEDSELETVLSPSASNEQVRLSIGRMSPMLAGILGRTSARMSRMSMQIRGVSISQNDATVALLEKVANSLFFQLDLSTNVPMALIRERRLLRTSAFRRPDPVEPIHFPRYEYDQRACQLYWYARSATGMPLLQFLAYYQCLEFYFPIYSQLEAQRRVRGVLKNPMFSPHRDVDVNAVLLAAKSASGRGFGDERSQLRATIQECVTAEALKSFLVEDDERKEFFSAKKQELNTPRLNLGANDSDLRNDVADRIYDIRCKIVHTKHSGGGDEVELLLPFSSEADALGHDIQLVWFIARHVLITASGPLSL